MVKLKIPLTHTDCGLLFMVFRLLLMGFLKMVFLLHLFITIKSYYLQTVKPKEKNLVVSCYSKSMLNTKLKNYPRKILNTSLKLYGLFTLSIIKKNNSFIRMMKMMMKTTKKYIYLMAIQKQFSGMKYCTILLIINYIML